MQSVVESGSLGVGLRAQSRERGKERQTKQVFPSGFTVKGSSKVV